MKPWWMTLLLEQRAAQFDAFSGATASLIVPVSDRLISDLVGRSLSASVRELEIRAMADNQLSVGVRLRIRPGFPASTRHSTSNASLIYPTRRCSCSGSFRRAPLLPWPDPPPDFSVRCPPGFNGTAICCEWTSRNCCASTTPLTCCRMFGVRKSRHEKDR